MRLKIVAAINLVIFKALTSFSCAAQQVGQETYSFTQAFVGCVKERRNEQDAKNNSGAATTGAIGGTLSNGQPLSADRRYWNYMDCITPTSSGMSRQALPVGSLCAATEKIPSGTEGKTYSSHGATWTCLSGNWVVTEGAPSIPSRADCSGRSFSQLSCTFSAEPLRHGQSVIIKSTASNLSEKSGTAVASCNDGEISLSNIVCESKRCNAGEYVTWFEQDHNALSRCRGKVNALGEAQAENSVKFYSSMNEALLRSTVLDGHAQYECRGDKWTLISGSCKRKTQQEMNCQTRANALGKLEYYCL